MLKYYHGLKNSNNMLLYDAYLCSKELHFNKVNTCF